MVHPPILAPPPAARRGLALERAARQTELDRAYARAQGLDRDEDDDRRIG